MKLRFLALMSFAFLCLGLVSVASPVSAQSGNETAQPALFSDNLTVQPVAVAENTTVKFKDVDLWVDPEYDDALKLGVPSLLTMMEGELDGVNAPVTVSFLVPSSAEMNSAGSLTGRNGQGYKGGPPNRVASSIPGWDEVSYTLNTNIFRVEYYDPSIITGDPNKAISYDFKTISQISNLTIYIQQPRNSSKFSVTPAGAPGVDGEGYKINSYSLNNITSDADLHFDIAYTKGGSAGTGLVIGIVLSVIVVGGGALYILKSRQRKYVPVRSSGKPPRQRSAKRSQGVNTGQRTQGGKFCTKCGAPTSPTDKFCPTCGNKLRDSG